MSKYRVYVADIEPRFPLESLKQHNCFVGISLNNKNFADKYLPDLLGWIGKHFDHCTLVIGDYIHRYNLQIFEGLNEKEAALNALKQGDEIYKSVHDIISRNGFTSFSLFRWLDNEIGVNDNPITDFKVKIKNSSELMRDVNQLSIEFLRKQEFRNNPIICTKEKAIKLCDDYMIEEMFFMNQMSLMGSNVSVYPGTQFQILKNISAHKYSSFETALSDIIYIDLGIKK